MQSLQLLQVQSNNILIMTEIQAPAPYQRQEKETKGERRSSIATQEECQSTVNEMLQKLKIVHPRFQCPSSNEVTHMCTNRSCKENSLCCQLQNCSSCFSPHLICQNIKLHGISHLLEKFTEGQRQFFLSLFEVENAFIESIYAKRKRLIEKYYWGNIQPKYREIIDSIYFNHIENYRIDSALAQEFFLRLKREVYDKKQMQKELLADFKKEAEDLGFTFEKIEKRIIEAFNYSSIRRSIIKSEGGFLENSKIIESSDTESKRFIRDSLCNPSKVELIFRASENQFEAAKFHKFCDNIPNTFTLVKTEFENVIGGYTPIPWNVAPNTFAYETTNSSFLLSVDLRQKMKLVHPEIAVGCSPNLGPLFGQYDIRISDHCNANYDSFSNFPQSYNFDMPYPKNQQTTTLFCGPTNGNRFKVVQYEVYRVTWDNK